MRGINQSGLQKIKIQVSLRTMLIDRNNGKSCLQRIARMFQNAGSANLNSRRLTFKFHKYPILFGKIDALLYNGVIQTYTQIGWHHWSLSCRPLVTPKNKMCVHFQRYILKLPFLSLTIVTCKYLVKPNKHIFQLMLDLWGGNTAASAVPPFRLEHQP